TRTTNKEWTVEHQNEDWITVEKEGNKLKVTTKENTLLDRVGMIVLKSSELDITILVRQAGFSENTIELDRSALIILYHSLGGPGYLEWDITKPLTESAAWPGVSVENVDGAPRVTKINIIGKKFKGTLPEEIG